MVGDYGPFKGKMASKVCIVVSSESSDLITYPSNYNGEQLTDSIDQCGVHCFPILCEVTCRTTHNRQRSLGLGSAELFRATYHHQSCHPVPRLACNGRYHHITINFVSKTRRIANGEAKVLRCSSRTWKLEQEKTCRIRAHYKGTL